MPRVGNFADIIKISTIFIERTFKDSKKVERIWNYVLQCNIYLYFSITKVSDFYWKNTDVSRTQGVCHVIYMFIGSSLGKV